MLRFQFIEEFEQVLFAAGGGTPVQIDDGDPLLAQALGEEFQAHVDHLRRRVQQTDDLRRVGQVHVLRRDFKEG